MKKTSGGLNAGPRPGPMVPSAMPPKVGAKGKGPGSPKGDVKSPAPRGQSGNRSTTIR